MVKMKDRNAQLKQTLGSMENVSAERVKEAVNLPKENTVNRQGFKAYKVEDTLRLISMLNTLKLQPQFYRSENQTIKELEELIHNVAINESPYFVAQCIVYSRCVGEGMRSINHLAACILAPLIAGTDWSKRFYSLWDKKNQKGGCIFRPDDMSEIKDAFSALNKVVLTNAMKKGFATALENLDAYSILKYKKTVIDIANLVHPRINKCLSEIEVDSKSYKAVDAVLKGLKVSADTWEVAQVGAGQEVAKAVKEGKLTKEKAEQVLKEAKSENWKSLMVDGKLGILAALRNIRNILKNATDQESIDLLCELVSDSTKILQGKIMPYQIDLAYETCLNKFGSISNGRKILDSLQRGYLASVPNLKEALPGKNLVILDCSGSMNTHMIDQNTGNSMSSSCLGKASLIAATIAKATNADIILFGSRAQSVNYDFNENVFTIADRLKRNNLGGTNLTTAFDLITRENRIYDRIFILSDNECNSYESNRNAYKTYIKKVCSPYIYSVDLAAYGTKPIDNVGKVNYYYGYGYSMFTDIASKEFNPQMHIEKIRKIVI